jgi:hypothetical protein
VARGTLVQVITSVPSVVSLGTKVVNKILSRTDRLASAKVLAY